MRTPLTGRRRPRNNNTNEPPALRRRTAGGRVNVRRVNNNMAGINQYGTFLPQRLIYGNNNAANNNWMKPGTPRVIRTLPYTTSKELINEISRHNFVNGNIGYLMFRRGIPVLYKTESLYGMIKTGPQRRHINTVNNLNHFLARVKNNKKLFTNAVTRRNITQGNIRKVQLKVKVKQQVSPRNRAASVIQSKFRKTRRR